jgi:hypothetical protein
MVALVVVETVLLVLLLVLVAGLLRSHAEILRRLGPAGDGADIPQPESRVPRGTEADVRAPALTGTTLEGDAVSLAFDVPGAPTLLAFLTSGCSTCAGFWATLAEPRLPAGVQTLIVTRGTDREQPAKLRELAPAAIPVVMSSQAWADYRVPGAPYFVLVDGGIMGEGVATTWTALASLVSDAVADEREAEPGAGGGPSAHRRSRAIDATFAAAGIGNDHPSLRPGSAEGGE